MGVIPNYRKMNKITTLLLLTISIVSFGQTEIVNKQYQKADSLYQAENNIEAYKIFKEIEIQCDKKDTLYDYILWYYNATATLLEKEERSKQNWSNALEYGLESLELIKKGENYFDDKFQDRKYWMYKNLIVSYFGLNQLSNAKKYQKELYSAYKDKTLPDGIDHFYNFEFFKWKDKNIWAYEYYPELGAPETKGSFSKIEYYIYSTNADGSDNKELYRLLVLKFHKFDNSVKFDYVLTKRLITATDEVSGTLYDYTYTKPIDYDKLRKDIKEVLNGNYQPNTKSVIKKK